MAFYGIPVPDLDRTQHLLLLGDTPVVTRYSEYRGFGNVYFPMRIQQSIAGSPNCSTGVSTPSPPR